MIQSVSQLMDIVERTLREEVLPQLPTDHARSQLAGVMEILGNLDRLLAWSPDGLRARLASLDEGYAAIAAIAAAQGVELPIAPTAALPGPRQADLEEAVNAGERRLVKLADWLFDSATRLPESLRTELDKTLRKSLRSALVAERGTLARANFSAMTARTD